MSERPSRTKTIIGITLAVAGLVVYWLHYNWLRSWSDTIGFDPRRSLLALVFAFVIPLVYVWYVVLPLSAAYLVWSWRRARSGVNPWTPPWRSVAIALLGIAVVGGVTAELWVHLDEERFRREVAAHTFASSDEAIRRDRRWPNGGYEMCYTPARGYWVND